MILHLKYVTTAVFSSPTRSIRLYYSFWIMLRRECLVCTVAYVSYVGISVLRCPHTAAVFITGAWFVLCHHLQKALLAHRCAKWQKMPLSKTSVGSIYCDVKSECSRPWWQGTRVKMMCSVYSGHWRNWAKQKVTHCFPMAPHLPTLHMVLLNPW